MSDHHTPVGRRLEGGARHRGRSRGRRVLLGILVTVALLVGAGLGVATFVDHQIAEGIESLGDPFEPLPTRPPTHDERVAGEDGDDATQAAAPPAPVNILLLGSDSRISAGDPSQWEEGAQRTDAILLLHLPADRERAYVMSIPRDSWVDIPGRGQAKINAAFSYGGPSLLVHTVEQLTHVRIDHILVTDFESFGRLTDRLGGVQVTIPETTYDRRRGETIPAGTYEMDGAEALDYVRQRYGLPGGDLDRVERQQNWIRSIGAQAMVEGVLDNPFELTRLLYDLRGSFAADDGFTVDRMRELALSTRPIDEPRDLVFFTAPVTGLGTSDDGQSIVVLDRDRLAAVTAAIGADDVAQFLADHPGYLRTLGERVD